ncbi:MAG: DUF4342 domain-containing protein [Desulfobacterales bacterium]
MEDHKRRENRNWIEEIEIVASQLIRRVTRLVKEGNVRRLIIRNAHGRALIEIPLTAGVAVGGAAVVIAPLLTGLGALAALMAKFRVEVVRSRTDDEV